MSPSSEAMKALRQAAQATGFALSRCCDCAHRFYPPQSYCPVCLSTEVDAVADDGSATVLSTTRIHRSLDPALADRLPLHVACVSVATGLSLFAMAEGMLAPGSRVRLQWRDGLIHAMQVFEDPPAS